MPDKFVGLSETQAKRIASSVDRAEKLSRGKTTHGVGRASPSSQIIKGKVDETIERKEELDEQKGKVKIWLPEDVDDEESEDKEAEEGQYDPIDVWPLPGMPLGQKYNEDEDVICAYINGRWYVLDISGGFWAKVGERDGKRYAWEKLKPLPLDEEEVLGEGDYGEGSTENQPAFETHGSEAVIEGDIVWLRPAMGEDYFVFDYTPGTRSVFTAEDIEKCDAGASRTMVSAEVDLYENEDGTLTSTGKTVEVFNWTRSEIKANRFLLINYSPADKCWYIGSEDCGSNDEDEDDEE